MFNMCQWVRQKTSEWVVVCSTAVSGKSEMVLGFCVRGSVRLLPGAEGWRRCPGTAEQ